MQSNKKVLLIGGTSGVGKALLEQMSEDNKVEQIFATFHEHQHIKNGPEPKSPNNKDEIALD